MAKMWSRQQPSKSKSGSGMPWYNRPMPAWKLNIRKDFEGYLKDVGASHLFSPFVKGPRCGMRFPRSLQLQ